MIKAYTTGRREQLRTASGRLVLVGGLLLLGLTLWPALPRDTDLEYELGPRHAEVVELRVAYVQGGEEMGGARFPFPDGAPASVRHTVRLPSGRFEVRLELRGSGGRSRTLTRMLTTPSEGRVRIAAHSEDAS